MITPLGEILAPPRMAGTAVRLGLQVFLVVCLWRGLYAGSATMVGIGRDQAVTFAVLAVLATRIRGLDRYTGRDEVVQHMQYGTIAYWFLRPISPHRYYVLRAVGDQLYGFAWVLCGYLVCLPLGFVQPPVSVAVAGVFVVALVLGQLVLLHIMMLIDLLCFWSLRNNGAMLILVFAQNLLSGVYAPLWYFPHWFVTFSGLLPFQATLNVPLSLYIGRIPLADAPAALTVQLGWALALALFTRWLWHRAAQRVVAQGG